jgi:hypothetical protein
LPRIKRWAPISHEFNHDPEVIELRLLFGDWMALVWLELLIIADRNEGEIRGSLEYICRSLTWLWLSNSKRYNTEWRANRVRMALEWMQNKNWIRIESESIQIVKFLKYHRTPEHKQVPSEPDLTRPNHKEIKDQGKTAPKTEEKKTKELDPEVKRIGQMIFEVDRKKFARLIVWIKHAEQEHSPEVIAASLQSFLPYAEKTQNWYAYLSKILDKTEATMNAEQERRENDRRKSEPLPDMLSGFISKFTREH